MMTQIYSSVPAAALSVILLLIILRHALCEDIIFCFVIIWIILIMSGCLAQTMVMADDVNTEWDDGCPGLVETLAREVEWKDHKL
jgi:hypothetical protein